MPKQREGLGTWQREKLGWDAGLTTSDRLTEAVVLKWPIRIVLHWAPHLDQSWMWPALGKS